MSRRCSLITAIRRELTTMTTATKTRLAPFFALKVHHHSLTIQTARSKVSSDPSDLSPLPWKALTWTTSTIQRFSPHPKRLPLSQWKAIRRHLLTVSAAATADHKQLPARLTAHITHRPHLRLRSSSRRSRAASPGSLHRPQTDGYQPGRCRRQPR